ncbi:alpha/beta-type small acid-soluble spore protein [Paenibacillus thailandensis]|uniref:Alpha/beta-type small acid-soluble spore protein n=1 Tax=Paenibacillus thailandensis TaxID=393250 RepID=A0ABW5R4H5_9BACL
MGRRSNRRLLVPEARSGMETFKAQVMRSEGYAVDPSRPEEVKYEVASSLGIPLQHGDNGELTTESAGKIGGKIGGTMVREMIRLAQEQLNRDKQ